MFLMNERNIPLYNEWDVIVVGGGPAGCAAAIASARTGKKTLLIEATGSLGGMGTMGMIPAWCPFSDGEKIIYKGIAEEVFNLSKASTPHVPATELDWVPINSEKLKVIYDDLVKNSGADILFNTMLSSVEMQDEGVISAIIVSNKKGLTAYKAKVYIDATGDGDLAAWAGAEYVKGDNNGELQGTTLCFTLGNVDEYGYFNGESLHASNKSSPIYDIVSSGKYPKIQDTHICNNLVAPETVGFNAGHIWNVDNTEPQTVSDALIEGRKIADEFCKALVDYHPKAFSNAYVSQTAPLMGIRETRRIIGDYILTREDYINRQSFDDEIGRNSYYIDVHLSPKEKEQLENGELDMNARTARYNKGESHGIPYCCLTPKGITNLLVAGRSISCDREVMGSTRVMPVCLVTGEAAGTAAALACNKNTIDVHTLNVTELRSKLKENGAYFN